MREQGVEPRPVSATHRARCVHRGRLCTAGAQPHSVQHALQPAPQGGDTRSVPERPRGTEGCADHPEAATGETSTLVSPRVPGGGLCGAADCPRSVREALPAALGRGHVAAEDPGEACRGGVRDRRVRRQGRGERAVPSTRVSPSTLRPDQHADERAPECVRGLWFAGAASCRSRSREWRLPRCPVPALQPLAGGTERRPSTDSSLGPVYRALPGLIPSDPSPYWQDSV